MAFWKINQTIIDIIKTSGFSSLDEIVFATTDNDCPRNSGTLPANLDLSACRIKINGVTYYGSYVNDFGDCSSFVVDGGNWLHTPAASYDSLANVYFTGVPGYSSISIVVSRNKCTLAVSTGGPPTTYHVWFTTDRQPMLEDESNALLEVVIGSENRIINIGGTYYTLTAVRDSYANVRNLIKNVAPWWNDSAKTDEFLLALAAAPYNSDQTMGTLGNNGFTSVYVVFEERGVDGDPYLRYLDWSSGAWVTDPVVETPIRGVFPEGDLQVLNFLIPSVSHAVEPVNVVIVDGKVVGEVEVNPIVYPGVNYTDLALPSGSVLRNTVFGKKYLAGGGSEIDFVEIPDVVDPDWRLAAGANAAWAILQSM